MDNFGLTVFQCIGISKPARTIKPPCIDFDDERKIDKVKKLAVEKQFSILKDEARFLFGDEVISYLDHIGDEYHELNTLRSEGNSHNEKK